MADIFTEIEAGTTYADVKDILVGMAEAWGGPGAADAVATWGDMRTILNAAATGAEFDTIANAEIGSSVRTKLNALRENLIVPSLFADGTDGFYFDFSKTDRLFQDLIGTPADGAGENIHLAYESHSWQGRTLAQEIASRTPALVDDFSTYADTPALQAVWSGSNGASVSLDTSQLKVTNDLAAFGRSGRLFTTVAGQHYRVSFKNNSASAASLRVGTTLAGAELGTVTVAAGQVASLAFVASGTSTSIGIQNGLSTLGYAGAYDDFRVDAIPGNHGLQATTAAQPKWQTGGLARFDGSDDALLTSLMPGAAMTLMFKAQMPATSGSTRLIMGSGDTNANCYIGQRATSGVLAAAVGSQATNTIQGTTGDVGGQIGVGALTVDGSLVKLHWNGVEVYSGAQAGTPTPTYGVAVGAANVTGSVSGFANADLYYTLSIKKALTAAEIAAITNLWGTS